MKLLNKIYFLFNLFFELKHPFKFLNISSCYEKYTIKLRNRMIIDIRTQGRDKEIFEEIFLWKVYKHGLSNIGKSSIIIDIGAHIGLFSLRVSQEALKVYAYEPVPDNYNLLINNLNKNKIKNVIPAQKAIGNRNTTRYIYLNQNHYATHSFYNNRKDTLSTNKYKSEVVRLDSEIKKYDLRSIDLLKIDCEGAEVEIIQSLDQQTLNKIKTIVYEYHDELVTHAYDKIYKYLTSRGFKVSKLFELHAGLGMAIAHNTSL